MLCPITAVRFGCVAVNGEEEEQCVLAGAGPELRVYKLGSSQPLARLQALPAGARIHGVEVGDRLLVYGGRHVSLVSLRNDITRIELNEWVHIAKWLHGTIWLAMGHGGVAEMTNDLSVSTYHSAPQRELTWAAAMCESGGNVLVAHGTSFGDIVLRTVPEPLSSSRCTGHVGAVTSLQFSTDGARFVSTSVDRTVRVWTVRDATLTPLNVYFGHRARVWDAAFCGSQVVSAGEDRHIRVWDDGEAVFAYRAHDGRNVWTVDCGQGLIASGGDDGALKLRSLSTSERLSSLYELPGGSIRGKSGTRESARTIVLDGDRVLYISTDFGRLLRCTLPVEHGALPTWKTLFRDPGATAFAPHALVVVHGFAFSGRTDGRIVVVRVGERDVGENAETDAEVTFHGTRGKGRMVMGLYGSSDNGLNATHLFVMTPHGEVVHWILRHDMLKSFVKRKDRGGISKHTEESNSEAVSFLGTYRHQVLKKNMLGTCANFLSCCDVLLVGDRGGRISAYSTEANTGQGDDNAKFALCYCRPHSDRVTTLQVLSNRKENDGKCTHKILACAFDGRMSRLELQVETKVNPSRYTSASVKIVSSQRSIERVDTISKAFFPSVSMNTSEEDRGRACVLGFRSTDAVMWDVEQRNELFRSNCGNWRRAFDMYVELYKASEMEESLTIKRIVFAFWRAGRLTVESQGDLRDDETESRVQTVGASCHGQRVNSMDVISEDDHNQVYIMTAGEDTTVRVMKLIKGEKWQTVQILTQHISGVYGVSVTRNSESKMFAFSVGGCDEIIVWSAEKSCGPWKSVSKMRGGDDIGTALSGVGLKERSDDEGEAFHRCLSVACFPFGHCTCGEKCVMAAVGRSDGSLSLIRCARRNGANETWRSDVVARSSEESGAVMCVSTCQSDESTLTVISGDSVGWVSIWKVSVEAQCRDRIIELERRFHIHEGGVLSVDCVAMDESIVCASGGDDGQISMTVMEGSKVVGAQQLVSAAAVGAVRLRERNLLAVAMCQGVWRWSASSRLDVQDIERVGDTEICDASEAQLSGECGVIVVGHGLQYLWNIVS